MPPKELRGIKQHVLSLFGFECVFTGYAAREAGVQVAHIIPEVVGKECQAFSFVHALGNFIPMVPFLHCHNFELHFKIPQFSLEFVRCICSTWSEYCFVTASESLSEYKGRTFKLLTASAPYLEVHHHLYQQLNGFTQQEIPRLNCSDSDLETFLIYAYSRSMMERRRKRKPARGVQRKPGHAEEAAIAEHLVLEKYHTIKLSSVLSEVIVIGYNKIKRQIEYIELKWFHDQEDIEERFSSYK